MDGKLHLSQSVAPHFAPCFRENGYHLRIHRGNGNWRLRPVVGRVAVQNAGAGNGNSNPKKIEISFTRKKMKKIVLDLHFWIFSRFDDGVKSHIKEHHPGINLTASRVANGSTMMHYAYHW